MDTVKRERWKRVEELYHGALERGPDERNAFLDAACAGDGALLGEVRSLLGYEQRAERFIEDPRVDDSEDRLAGGPLSIEEALVVFRQIARAWRQRARRGSPS
jgi:hypothetical protein